MESDLPRADVRDREELLCLLGEAAAFEHTVLCTYLYALFSLRRPAECLDAGTSEFVAQWRATLEEIAREELVHLCEVNNLMTALGGSPHLRRPDFPVPVGFFPAGVVFELAPADLPTLEHFLYLERPEGVTLRDGTGFVHPAHFDRTPKTHYVSPTPRDYVSQGQLYHEIGLGLFRLSEEFGESGLFCGHPTAQLGGEGFPIEGIAHVHDIESALRVIDVVVLQGEGAPGLTMDSHYARLSALVEEYSARVAAEPGFSPSLPCARDPWLHLGMPPAGRPVITAEPARHVVDVGNSVYALFLRALGQAMTPVPVPVALRQAFAEAALRLFDVLLAAGDTAARLPLAEGSELHAGLTFQLPSTQGLLSPVAAAKLLAERASELSAAAEELMKEPEVRALRAWEGVPGPLRRLARDLDAIHLKLEQPLAAALGASAG
jgi:hypothetical protein